MDASDLDWDLLRHFLAAMRTNTLREAAGTLGVSHPTIRRRLSALEAQLGVTLFERGTGGLQATPAASELLSLAEQVEAAVQAVGRRATTTDTALAGPIRVTVPDLLMSHLLMPDLVAFADRWPQIRLQVEPSYEVADLGDRRADVAIRAMPIGTEPSGSLVGRRAAQVYTAIYGRDHQWIGWYGDERDRAWTRDQGFPNRTIVAGMPNMFLQKAACMEGLGLALLPCFLAEPDLGRRTDPTPSIDIWVLVHPDLRRAPRLRLFRDEMVAALERLQPRLAGEAVEGAN
ncbi:MAG: DNA-binding transcriptional LysR family regulator [Myxococcota bacterium]|jgi:DNA-binding transcriptional LysR family regulator